jgi:hypothetical protein
MPGKPRCSACSPAIRNFAGPTLSRARVREKILKIADDSSRNYVRKTRVDGNVTWVFDKENIARQRLRIAIPKRGSGWRPESREPRRPFGSSPDHLDLRHNRRAAHHRQRPAAGRRGVVEMNLSAGEGHRAQVDELPLVRMIGATEAGHGAGEGADVVRQVLDHQPAAAVRQDLMLAALAIPVS